MKVDKMVLSRCVGLLEGETSDEDKFAGLLLITKIIEPTDLDSLSFIFSRISFSFLRRLLATSI